MSKLVLEDELEVVGERWLHCIRDEHAYIQGFSGVRWSEAFVVPA